MGKIIINDIGKDYFRFISSNEEETVFAAVVYSKALKRNIMLVIPSDKEFVSCIQNLSKGFFFIKIYYTC